MAQDDVTNNEYGNVYTRQNPLLREKELDEFRKELANREAVIEHRMQQEKERLAQRERDFHEAMENRTKSLSQHEYAISKRQEQLELEREHQQAMLEKARADYVARQYEVDELRRTLETEKQRLTEEGQQSLQDNSRKFVGSALTFLTTKESKFHFISGMWAVAGALSLLAGVFIAVATMVSSGDDYHRASGAGLGYYFFHLFRGLVVVGLCGVLSRYAFIFSKSYMHESLKIGERAHAIRFGEFYLDTYGANAEWEQVKEAFAHWNISGESAFSKGESQAADPSVVGAAGRLVDKAIEAASNVTKKAE
ncbi:hypothetical protein [Pseudomonas syringae]|uniref:hypothetical protein n=1 Tax=Pseudomonas syringae TaxID=317 RepID=UPI000E3252A0|nr:hypothetical protein [Pseudomonas syringae]